MIACDISEAKLKKLRETLGRLNLRDRVESMHSDRALSDLASDQFDLVLVDAPCSGMGTLRRHPEIRYRRKHESLTRLVRLQCDLLNRASRLVAPQGLLAYTICTITREEGEAVAEDFLAGHPTFALAPARNLPFDAEPFRTPEGLYRTWTHRHGCDSFTIARFRRQS